MTIPGSNFCAVMFLIEIHIQCMLVERYADKLEQGAQHWIKLEGGEDFDGEAAPIDILAWCTVCLAAMAAIRRLVVAGESNPRANRRRVALKNLLGDPELPCLSSALVRNSWEHLDDRLDRILPSLTQGTLSHIHVAATPPKPNAIALKRFDPVNFVVHFVTDAVPLRARIEEVKDLRQRIDRAMVRLQTETIDVWSA
ncbi:MAG: hypothetical protein AB1424_06120 [Thermodesulfobacteriota bacterium]